MKQQQHRILQSAAVFAASLYIYTWIRQCTRPLVVCKGPLQALLQQQCKLLFSIYRPPMLAFNPHIMTALGGAHS